MFAELIKKFFAEPKAFVLSNRAMQVLKRAEAEGFQIARQVQQGAHVIILENETGGKSHLWSSDDVEEYGRNRKWI